MVLVLFCGSILQDPKQSGHDLAGFVDPVLKIDVATFQERCTWHPFWEDAEEAKPKTYSVRTNVFKKIVVKIEHDPP